MGTGKCFCQRKLYLTRDVPEANCLPQGLEPPAKPPAKPAPNAANPRVKCSQTFCPGGEPIPVAPVEYVYLFKVKYSRQKKWHTEPVSEQSRTCIPRGSCSLILWFICPCVCVTCFVSRVLCIVMGGGGRGNCLLGYVLSGGARIPLQAGNYCARGWGGSILWLLPE